MSVAYIFFVLCCLKFALCQDQCVVYDFEENFQERFSACSEGAPWTLGSYSSTPGIVSPNPLSANFISPDPTPGVQSCTSSFQFTIQNTGSLELNIYTEIDSPNLLTVNFYRAEDQSSIYSSQSSIIQSGVNTLQIPLQDISVSDPFQGYFNLVGSNTAESKLLIDSFRYIPQGSESAPECTLYQTQITEAPSSSINTENPNSVTPTSDVPTSIPPSTDVPTSVASTTDAPTSDIPSTPESASTVVSTTETPITEISTTEISTRNGCVSYQFGMDFYDTFNSDGVCSYMYDWDLRNYTIYGIESNHAQSYSYIAPLSLLSCTASFVFPMASQGVLEVNVFVDRYTFTDTIEIIIYELNNGGATKIVGLAEYNQKQPNFAVGWNTLQIPISGTGEFDGYFAIMGKAAYNSVILVDSFKYVPPSMSSSECSIYD